MHTDSHRLPGWYVGSGQCETQKSLRWSGAFASLLVACFSKFTKGAPGNEEADKFDQLRQMLVELGPQTTIIRDPTHPLHNSLQLLPSARRYTVTTARTDLVKKIIHLNCHQHHQQVTMNSFSVFILRCCVFMFNCVFNLWSFLFYVQLWSASKMNFRCFPNGQ